MLKFKYCIFYTIILLLGFMYIIYATLNFFFIKVLIQKTDSMPKGFYLSYSSLHFNRYDDVVFPTSKIKSNEYLTSKNWVQKYPYLIKRIVGIPGDFLCIRSNRVHINAIYISKVYKYDKENKSLPIFNYCDFIPKDYFFVQGVSSNYSFDSRYFGLIQGNLIRGKAVKL